MCYLKKKAIKKNSEVRMYYLTGCYSLCSVRIRSYQFYGAFRFI